VARALIVGCGCRGRELADAIAAAGWVVRGTSRTEDGAEEIRSRGHEAAVADPDHPAGILELVGDVTVMHWLLGSATGPAENLEAIHGPRLERLLEHLVDTPVRGVVYEAAGSVPPRLLAGGAALVREASERWRIPARLVEADPADRTAWPRAAAAATTDVLRP
jgi:nucleoside-diphosphate-sugar epimerase